MSAGGSYGQSHSRSKPQLTPQELVDLYGQSFPSTLGVTTGQAGNTANQLAGAAAGANPIYTASGLSQLQNYAPGYSQVGNEIAGQVAGNTAALTSGAGAQTALTGEALNRLVSPEYYGNRAQIGQANSNLLNSFGQGPNLGGGEMAAAERAINQYNTGTGNLGNNNATNTIGNALNFGEYARQKQQLFGNAIEQVNSTLPNLQNSGFNVGQTAVGQATNATNTGNSFALGQFNPAQANPNLTAPLDFGQSTFDVLGGLGSAQRSKSSAMNVSGNAGCCFIFLEIYNGKLPWYVRICRDYYYKQESAVATGYRRMAQWLVPLMQQYKPIAALVNFCMVKPISEYGGYIMQVNKTGWKYKFVKKFWFNVWSTIS